MQITDRMIQALIDAYKSNREDLRKVDLFIKKHGCLDNGNTDSYETFEMGYNNALEYVFLILGIKDYR